MSKYVSRDVMKWWKAILLVLKATNAEPKGQKCHLPLCWIKDSTCADQQTLNYSHETDNLRGQLWLIKGSPAGCEQLSPENIKKKKNMEK